MDDDNNSRGLTIDQVPQPLPMPSTTYEALPKLTIAERIRLDVLSSLNFAEFQSQNTSILMHPERHLLFKAFRILEWRVERLMARGLEDEKNRIEAFLVFLKLGHICLLAGDYARALSAYQQSLNLRDDLFWRDEGGYYGLGIVYLHFKSYGSCIESFNRHLYSNPSTYVSCEVNGRLGVAYKAVRFFNDALRHFNSSLHDIRESSFLSKPQLKLNVALCHDSGGEIEKAYHECQQLLQEEIVQQQSIPAFQLRAAIHRELGWLCYRAESELPAESEVRKQKLVEAEDHLNHSKQLAPDCGKTYYYLGRCYGEQAPARAHDAFVHYRFSIDKSEADADTWCSIGVLYSQQQQPMDALQAFVCAVDLDPEHSAAWANLGQLYEVHMQYGDALDCYKNAVKYNPGSPDQLKARILVLERELGQSRGLANPQQNQRGQHAGQRLPPLKDAGMQPIPSELRQRQEEFLKNKQSKYREGSPLWRMGELSTTSVEILYEGQKPLEPCQTNMLRILKFTERFLDESSLKVLRSLEERERLYGACDGSELPLSEYSVRELPPGEQSSLNALKHFRSLFDVEDDDKMNVKDEPEDEESQEENEEESKEEVKEVRDSHSHLIPPINELPTTFSLLAPLRSPMDTTSAELLDACHLRVDRPSEFKEIFDERVAPPRPPEPPANPPNTRPDQLNRPTPLIIVESRKDAHSIELQRFCETSPIALIRGLTTQLKMDLSLFSTKSMNEIAPSHEIEVRTQYRMPPDLNVDHLGRPTWACESSQRFTTVDQYAQYQADTFKHSLKEEAEKLRSQGAKYGSESAAKKRRLAEEAAVPMKTIRFGTNLDLSDDTKFKAQLTELAKMPPFCRVIAGCNLLSHLGHVVLGMNTVQLYMKVPGARTPGHMENNCLASVNINIGPGDCEWFGVPYEYWGVIEKRCKEQGIDFLKGSWWPNHDELLHMGVPVYRFTQKAGDMVWVGGGCVHWVQSTGWCNNVAWNVGPITPQQLTMAVHQYEYNKLCDYKSLVPMQHLFWQIAKNVRVTNQKVYSLIRGMLIRSLAYCKMVADFAESRHKQIKMHRREAGDPSPYCCLCEIEVFNILFVREQAGKFAVSCVECARKANLQDYHVLQQTSFQELCQIFDNFQLHMISKQTLVA